MPGSAGRFILLFLSLAVADSQAQDFAAAPADPATASGYFRAGQAAFEREDYATAIEHFVAAIAAGSEGPAARYNLAVSYYRLGEYRAAETAFRELGADYPAMASLADYNLGLALVRQGRDEEARRAFRRAAGADDAQVAALAAAMLERLPVDPAPAGATDGFVLLDLDLGYDDNVALIDPLTLPAGTSAKSPFGELLFYGEGAITDRWRLAGDVFLLQYPEADGFDQAVLDLAARYEWTAGIWSLAVGPRFGRSYIDGDGFEQTLGVALELSRRLEGIGATLELDLSHDRADDLEPRFAYIAGERERVSLRLSRALERSRLAIDVRAEQHDRAGAGVSADRLRYRLTWTRTLGIDWYGDLFVELRDTEYSRLTPARDEQRKQLGFLASRELESGWRFAIRYTYSDNDSSDARFAYRRHRASAGLSRLF